MRDVAGEAFFTAKGRLEHQADHQPHWVQGKRVDELLEVSLDQPHRHKTLTLIFRVLGVYAGQKMYAPCDDW